MKSIVINIKILKTLNKKEDINLAEIDPQEEGIVSRHHCAEIIEARLAEIFEMVNAELKKIGRERLLPAGVVLTGGTAKLPGAVDLAKDILGLPSQAGFPKPLGGLVDKVDEPSYATVMGLVLWGLDSMSELRGESSGFVKRTFGGLSGSMNGTVGNMRNWFGKFLP